MSQPTKESDKLVLLTGSTGVIGYNCLLHALRKGYRVRCVVRRESAIDEIKAGPSVQEYLHIPGRVEYVVVADNTVDCAYDAAMEGVHYVIHIAGNWPMPQYHPDNDLYIPFVRSMNNILSAADKNSTVRRVVFTQAGAGLTDFGEPSPGANMEQVLDEEIQPHPVAATRRPPLPSVFHAYSAAKAYCMSYLFEYQKRSDRLNPFQIVQVIPGTVIGPFELVSTAAGAYKRMDRISRTLLFDEKRPNFCFGLVGVDDVAAIHVGALDEEELPNPRPMYIAAASSGTTDAQKLWNGPVNMLERDFAAEIQAGIFKIGRLPPLDMPFHVNSQVTSETFLKKTKGFRSFEDIVKDVATWYARLLKND